MAIRYEDVEKGTPEPVKRTPAKVAPATDSTGTVEPPAPLPYGKPVKPEKNRRGR